MPREAIVHTDLTVQIVDSPIPEPKEKDVVIKVVVSGMNPKDWKIPA
jgi:NADPH2:quinone reductase